MDGFARAAAIVTGVAMLTAIMRNTWFAQLDEERDGPMIAALLVGLTLVGVAAIIIAETLGPHIV